MNEKKARETMASAKDFIEMSKAMGYLECLEKAKGLEDCLSDILFVLKNYGGSFELTEGKELVHTPPETDYDFVTPIEEALAKYEAEK